MRQSRKIHRVSGAEAVAAGCVADAVFPAAAFAAHVVEELTAVRSHQQNGSQLGPLLSA